MHSNDIVSTLRHTFIDSGRDTRYEVNAYLFVMAGLEFYQTVIGAKRHVSGQELALGLLEFAQKQFGPIAPSVLASWGITTTDDFGYIVYNLINIGLLGKQKDDSLEDFFNVADFSHYFSSHDSFEIDKNFIKTIKGT